ncbi:MAG TPA: GHKL domain-containing protein [Candidatus Scatovivens faecipullorum]|nr:GHKL domain-containing protein [Candidatus Scatovivens faecipullorum]
MKLENSIYSKEIIKNFRKRDLFSIIISIMGIVIAIIEMLEMKTMLQENSNKYVFYNIISTISIFLISIYGIFSRREAIINKIKIDILEEKNKNLSEVNDYTRCFKHDFNNIIQAIDGYIMVNDMAALQKYFSGLLKECNCMNSMDLLNNKGTENPAIYGVLLNKYKRAEENNINMNIDIMVSLDKFKEKSYVLSRMIGILLDNAIEATSECEEKIVNVQFVKEEGKNRNLIIIENTYNNKNVDTNKIFEKNFTTKEGNSGLGLWKIRDILSKDMDLDLYTTKDGVMFKQQLEIYK